MKIFLLSIIIILTNIFCQAQNPYYWKLTDEDGLPSLEIYDLLQDSKGYMWIATDGGLCRFDGQELIHYKHPFEKRTATSVIKEASNGTIWYKNFAGQLFFIDSTNQPQLFTLPNHITLNSYFEYNVTEQQLILISKSLLHTYTFFTQKWSSDTLLNCYQDGYTHSFLGISFQKKDEVLYFDCFKNLYIKEQQTTVPKGGIKTKSFNPLGTIRLGTHSDSLLVFDNNKVYIDHIDHITKLSPKALSLTYKGLQNAYYTGNNQIWILSKKGLILLQKDLSTNQWKVKQKLLENKSIGSFCKDKEGNLWLGTIGNGIFIINSLDISYYNTTNSLLANSKINCLEVTRDSQLLIGAAGGSFSQLNPKTKKIYAPISFEEYPITSIFYDSKRDQVFIKSNKEYLMDLKKGTIKRLPFTFYKEIIIYKENQLITGNFIALRTLHLNDNTTFEDYPPEFKKQFRNNEFLNIDTKLAVIIQRNRTTTLWADQVFDNYFWAGVNDSLFLYKDAIPIPIIDTHGVSIIPSDIHQDSKGIIWVSSINNGIYAIQKEKVIQHFTTKDGLPSNNCRRLTIYNDEIWIGTDKGIAKIHPKSRNVEVYNKLDGLLSNNIDDIEVVNQTVWAATSKGLISFGINTPSTNTVAPYISITQCKINDSTYTLKNHFSLSYNENSIQLFFKAIALKSRNNYTYEYRLLGLDSSWISQTSATNFVRFPKLNSGMYKFEVRARNEDGVPSQLTPQMTFLVHPPFWKTWWFIACTSLTLLFLLVFIIRSRYQSIQKKQATQTLITQLKMQALQSQMNPHFIFNAMSTIQSFWMYKDSKIALIYHAKFAKLMRLIFNYSNKKSIPIKDEIEFLNIYIDLEKIRLSQPVTIDFEIDDRLEEEAINIPPLLIQPIIENSFKHGFLHKEAACLLQIKLYKEEHYIHCIIEDDGVGRTAAKSYQGWKDDTSKKQSSSFVTQERLEMLNQTIHKSVKKITYKITDLKDKHEIPIGTKTELWIPIVENFL